MWARVLTKKTPRTGTSCTARGPCWMLDVDGRQREKSFKTKAEAEDYKITVLHQGKSGSFVDPKLGTAKFADYARGIVDAKACASNTTDLYGGILDTWIIPWAGSRSLQQVSKDRAGAAKLVNVTMAGADGVLLSYGRRATALGIILEVLNEAVAAELLAGHTLAGSRWPAPTSSLRRTVTSCSPAARRSACWPSSAGW